MLKIQSIGLPYIKLLKNNNWLKLQIYNKIIKNIIKTK